MKPKMVWWLDNLYVGKKAFAYVSQFDFRDDKNMTNNWHGVFDLSGTESPELGSKEDSQKWCESQVRLWFKECGVEI